ncbi:MAG TPA: flagellar export protein FliJ [Burkholderiaceae bacterium]|nr:flagellar export protein FliJ [Burkholderiaceae bacterium]
MDTLNTLLEQAEAERNIALAAFNQARARRDAARDQSRGLDGYRDEYRQRWHAQFQRGAALDIVRCYQQFADRLELAIQQQAHALHVCEAALARAEDTLRAHELRVASVRKLIERRRDEQQRTLARREQKVADDHAMRMARARRSPAAARSVVSA